MTKKKEQKQDEYLAPVVYDHVEGRDIIKYDREFPALFSLGNLLPVEENILFAILGELRDRFEDREVIFSYKELANLAGYTIFDNRLNAYVPRTGKAMEKKVDSLAEQIQNISYTMVTGVKEDGTTASYDRFVLFPKFSVDHTKKEVRVYLSNEVFKEAVYDADGNMIEAPKRIKDLFNNENWSKTKYMQLGRDFHNILRSQYSKRLYRLFAEYRNTGFVKISANFFEEQVMQLNTDALKRTKSQQLKRALTELNSILDGNGNKVFRDLKYKLHKKGRSIVFYEFTFKPFDVDLNRIVAVDGQKFSFDTPDNEAFQTHSPKSKNDMKEIMEHFYRVFPKGGDADNKNNKRQLEGFLANMDKDLIIEALNRTSVKSTRTFGWTRKMLLSCQDKGITTRAELFQYEDQGNDYLKDKKPKTNIPDWAQVEENKKQFDEEQKKIIEKFDSYKLIENFTEQDRIQEEAYLQIIKSWNLEEYESVDLQTRAEMLAHEERVRKIFAGEDFLD